MPNWRYHDPMTEKSASRATTGAIVLGSKVGTIGSIRYPYVRAAALRLSTTCRLRGALLWRVPARVGRVGRGHIESATASCGHLAISESRRKPLKTRRQKVAARP